MTDSWAPILAAVTKVLSTKISGQPDLARYPLDRALRVVRSIEKLAPDVGERIERPDLARVAALYAGVAQNVVGPGKTPDEQAYDDAAELASDHLKELLPATDLDQVLIILAEQRKRDTKLPEAKLLADALSMEEFGLIGFWNQCRQFHASSKSLEQLLKLWKAQHDYGYWDSRLREGFHYEITRTAAKERLAHMKGIYERLQREHLCEDLLGNAIGHF